MDQRGSRKTREVRCAQLLSFRCFPSADVQWHVAYSVADHMYRMAMIAMMIPTKGTDRPLDIGRCVQVSLFLRSKSI
jgi:hypothetical protein